MRGCHYGHDLAQRQIGLTLIELETRCRKAEIELRELRRTRDSRADAKIELIRIIQTRQLILRRIIDSILCTMIRNQTWILKRLIVHKDLQRIDPAALSETLRFAVERNGEERMRFSLVVDMTTFAHLGDLIEIDLTGESSSLWKVIELKEGRVNELLSGILDQKQWALTEDDLKDIGATLGEKAPKQALRMVRRRKRLNQVKKIIESDKGIDPQFNETIRLFPDPIDVDNYAEAVNKVCEGAIQKGADVAIVDGCLRLLAVKSEHIRATNMGLVYHSYYHMARPGQPCLLADSAHREEELHAMWRIPPFLDLIDFNLRAKWGTPLYLWLKPEYAFEVLMGRIKVFAQFDFQKFFELAASHNIQLKWISSDPGGRFAKFSAVIPGSPNARAVCAQFQDGTEQILLGGFFARALGDITTPMQLIELIERYPEQKKKMEAGGTGI